MATIKDVAKLAQVSLGTVSNVLNGKTRNEELIERVENAMKQLSYRPDATARSLKNTKTYTIGLVLPDDVQKQYQNFLMEIEKDLRALGYNLLVKFSWNNRMLERRAIDAFLESRVDAIVLYSTVWKKYYDEWESLNTPMLLISRHHVTEFRGDNIVVDYSGAFKKMLNELKRNHLKKVGLIIEKDLLKDGKLREIYEECYSDLSLIKIVDGSKERGFQAIFELCINCADLDGVIAGSNVIAEGIRKALKTLKREKIPVYVMKEGNWLEDAGTYAGEISVSQKKVAKETVSRLIGAIDAPQLHENITQYIPAQYENKYSSVWNILPAQNDLRFAMYECSSSRSLEMLSMVYERESGKKVFFDMYPYDEMEKMLYQRGSEKDDYYDGFMMDITWFEGLVESGCVKNLDHILHTQKNYLDGFIDGAVRDYGMYVESLYAIPFASGSQILFYQKDLFEDRALQMKFQRKYNEKLAPAQNWSQFNAIAEFFTQSYNPDSPVKYGVSMALGNSVYMAIDFLDRLWAYGGQIFDEFGKVCINSGSALSALKSLMQTYQYSSGEMLTSWDKVAEEFSSGNTAMVILYNSDVGNINNHTMSKVAGNIGYALIPGGVSVLGGWSLGLNRYGKHQEDAERFLLWACGNQNGIPLSLLGGSTLRKDYYERQDLENLEPWKNLILKSTQKSRKRVMPEILDESRWKNNIYTIIIPGEIMKVIKKEITEEEALTNMERRINQLLEDKEKI